MSEIHPVHPIIQTLDKLLHGVHIHLSNFLGDCQHHLSSKNGNHVLSVSSNFTVEDTLSTKKSSNPVSKEDLGRATWTFLHTLAAQYPDNPTRQQKKDVRELMSILSRIYPCKDCADHFKEVLRANPIEVGSQSDLSQWLCHVHNVINRSLGKVIFPCQRVDSRWGKLECENRACDVIGTTTSSSNDHTLR